MRNPKSSLHTIILKINPKRINNNLIKIASDIIKKGGLVAFPTETVYGLGADAFNEKAVKKIFEVKGRPPDNPLIVHISKKRDIFKLTKRIPYSAKILIRKFWPGPLTLVLEKSEKIPDIVTAGLNTVAIRMPNHRVALRLIDYSNTPIAAPSANKSGKPSPTLAKHVIEDFKDEIDCIIDSGETNIGLESTVIDLTEDPPILLRPGAITKEMLEKVIGRIRIETFSDRPKSPGMKYRHYAPNAKLILIENCGEKFLYLVSNILKRYENKKVALVISNETFSTLKEKKENKIKDLYIVRIGAREFLQDIAKRLFKILRDLDNKNIDVIIFEGFEEKGIGYAIMNRLRKAASEIIKI